MDQGYPAGVYHGREESVLYHRLKEAQNIARSGIRIQYRLINIFMEIVHTPNTIPIMVQVKHCSQIEITSHDYPAFWLLTYL